MKKLTIISAGVGNLDYLTQEAKDIISNHKNIYVSEKRFFAFKELNPRIKLISYSKLEQTIDNSKKDIAIIVSGDYGFYSIAKTLIRIFSEKKEIQLINGINSMQYFASKLNFVYHDWVSLSLHGSNANKLLAYVSYNEKVFLITGGKSRANEVCQTLLNSGFENLNIFVGENLSYENERIIFGSLQEISKMEFDELTVMLIENPYFTKANQVLKDTDFVNSKIPVTKDVLRWALVNKLELAPNDIVYNIGAGAGDVSVEIATKVTSGLVYSFDNDETSIKTMERNKIQNGAFNIFNIKAFVPYFDEQFYEENQFLQPSKVLISGNYGELDKIFDWVLELNPYCKIVMTTSSLDNFLEAISCYKKFNIEPEITSMNISNVENTEKGYLFFAENPMFILSGEQELEEN